MSFRLRPEAERDLDELMAYIADDNPTAARSVFADITGRIRRLGESPLIGRARPDLSPGLRHHQAGSYIILYEVADDEVTIVRIVHGSRDLRRLFGRPTT